MKKFICINALVFIFMLTGCSSEYPNTSDLSSQPDQSSANVAFISSMGCNDPNCTDASHHHDCPPDCTDYDHYHSCNLDCTETSHHHSSQTAEGNHGEHHDDGHH